MIDLDLEHKRFDIEEQEKWKYWCYKMPALRFDPSWDVYIIPPYAGAMARFLVRKGERFADVYFDAYSRLGWMMAGSEPIPYFELYPWENDVKRYRLDEVDELMNDIRLVLESDGSDRPVS